MVLQNLGSRKFFADIVSQPPFFDKAVSQSIFVNAKKVSKSHLYCGLGQGFQLRIACAPDKLTSCEDDFAHSGLIIQRN